MMMRKIYANDNAWCLRYFFRKYSDSLSSVPSWRYESRERREWRDSRHLRDEIRNKRGRGESDRRIDGHRSKGCSAAREAQLRFRSFSAEMRGASENGEKGEIFQRNTKTQLALLSPRACARDINVNIVYSCVLVLVVDVTVLHV